jgi:hypothetical protein
MITFMFMHRVAISCSYDHKGNSDWSILSCPQYSLRDHHVGSLHCVLCESLHSYTSIAVCVSRFMLQWLADTELLSRVSLTRSKCGSGSASSVAALTLTLTLTLHLHSRFQSQNSVAVTFGNWGTPLEINGSCLLLGIPKWQCSRVQHVGRWETQTLKLGVKCAWGCIVRYRGRSLCYQSKRYQILLTTYNGNQNVHTGDLVNHTRSFLPWGCLPKVRHASDASEMV